MELNKQVCFEFIMQLRQNQHNDHTGTSQIIHDSIEMSGILWKHLAENIHSNRHHIAFE